MLSERVRIGPTVERTNNYRITGNYPITLVAIAISAQNRTVLQSDDFQINKVSILLRTKTRRWGNVRRSRREFVKSSVNTQRAPCIFSADVVFSPNISVSPDRRTKRTTARALTPLPHRK